MGGSGETCGTPLSPPSWALSVGQPMGGSGPAPRLGCGGREAEESSISLRLGQVGLCCPLTVLCGYPKDTALVGPVEGLQAAAASQAQHHCT